MSAESENEASPIDARGVTLAQILLSFTTDVDIWDGLRKIGAEIDTSTEQWKTEFWSLPEERKAGAIYFSVHAHTHGKKDDADAHWFLVRSRMPRDEPPTRIAESSERIGSYPESLQRLVECIPAAIRESMRDVEAINEYILPKSLWKLSIAGWDAPSALHSETPHECSLTKASFTFANHPCLSSIAIEDVGPEMSLTVSASPQVPWSASLFEEIDVAVWNHVEPLLARTEGAQ